MGDTQLFCAISHVHFMQSFLFCLWLPKHFGCQKWKEEDTIENKMYQNRFPFYDSSGNSASTDQSCNIVVHKMQDDRDPDVVCFHISKSKEYAQCNTGDKLCGNTLKPCIRCIVKQVQREMPQSPEYTKDENSFSHSKMLLQDRLQKVTPSIFFSEKGGKDEEKADKQRKQWQPEHRKQKERGRNLQYCLWSWKSEDFL